MGRSARALLAFKWCTQTYTMDCTSLRVRLIHCRYPPQRVFPSVGYLVCLHSHFRVACRRAFEKGRLCVCYVCAIISLCHNYFACALQSSAAPQRWWSCLLKTNSDGAASVLIPAGRSDVQRMHPWPDFFSSHLLKFYPSFVSFCVLCADSSLDMLSWCAVPRRD